MLGKKKPGRANDPAKLSHEFTVMNDTTIAPVMPHSETKLVRVLFALIYSSLNRFEAERMGDHSLNSTVSTLFNRYGVEISRKREKVPTRFGKAASVVRYWIPPEARMRALKTLSQLRRRRD